MIDGTMGLFAAGFGLRPFMFDGIEIRGVRGEVFEGVTGVAQGVLNIGPFMEGGVIEEDDAGGSPLREEDVLARAARFVSGVKFAK